MDYTSLFIEIRIQGDSDSEQLNLLENNSPFTLPNDYKQFLLECNGLEGFIGENYLALWTIEDILDSMEENKLIIASDGGNIKYTLEKIDNDYVYAEEDFIGDYYRIIANSFDDFMKNFVL